MKRYSVSSCNVCVLYALIQKVINLSKLYYLFFRIFKKVKCIHPPPLFTPPPQGEDGFPGFKGDMGIKGDRVSCLLYCLCLVCCCC